MHADELAGAGEEQKARRSIALFQQLARESTCPHQQIDFLFRAVYASEGLDAKEALAIKRELYQHILKNFPGRGRRSEARLAYLQSYIDNEGLPAALEKVRSLDEAGEANLDVELYALADAHRQLEQLDAAKSLCEEIVARFPDGGATGAAYVVLAHMHQRDGDEENTVIAYRQAALAKAVNTNYGVMDASNTRNEAHEFLGEYYMEKEDWKEALHWWETWEPHSWCGNCWASMISHRKKMSEICRTKLKGKPEPSSE